MGKAIHIFTQDLYVKQKFIEWTVNVHLPRILHIANIFY